MKLLVCTARAAALCFAILATPTLAGGDAAAGAKVFGKCKVCHTVDFAGKNLGARPSNG